MEADFRTAEPRERRSGEELDLILAVLGPVVGVGAGVRRAHSAPLQARGRFEVAVPFGVLGGYFVKRLGLPERGSRVEVLLSVAPDGEGVVWHRKFGDRSFVTRLWSRDGLLIEEVGLAEFRYALQVEDGGLRYRQAEFRLRGRRLPPWFSPRVEAVVRDEGAGWRVAVQVRLPMLGTICAYEGILEEI